MNRITKIAGMTTVLLAVSAGPAFGAGSDIAVGSPTSITADVPSVRTPLVATPSVFTPEPAACASVDSIGLPIGVEVRSGTLADNGVGDSHLSTPALSQCAAVPGQSVDSVSVDARTVDLAPVSIALPAQITMDDSGAESQAYGLAAADADRNDDGLGVYVDSNAADVDFNADTDL